MDSRLCIRCTSPTVPRLGVLVFLTCLAGTVPGPRSRLTPRPPALGTGEVTLSGGSVLAGRRNDLAGTGGGDTYPLGRAGTGGGSSECWVTELPLFGDGSRKALSVMEPVLLWRCKVGLALPLDETEPDR